MPDTLIKLTGMYENVSAKSGKRYFVGYLGGVKLLMFETKDPKEGEPPWTLFIAERQQKAPADAEQARAERLPARP